MVVSVQNEFAPSAGLRVQSPLRTISRASESCRCVIVFSPNRPHVSPRAADKTSSLISGRTNFDPNRAKEADQRLFACRATCRGRRRSRITSPFHPRASAPQTGVEIARRARRLRFSPQSIWTAHRARERESALISKSGILGAHTARRVRLRLLVQIPAISRMHNTRQCNSVGYAAQLVCTRSSRAVAQAATTRVCRRHSRRLYLNRVAAMCATRACARVCVRVPVCIRECMSA